MRNKDLRQVIYLSIIPLIFVASSFELALIVGLVFLVTNVILKTIFLILNKRLGEKSLIYSYIIIYAGLITFITIILNTYLNIPEFIGLYLGLLIFNIGELSNNKPNYTSDLLTALTSFGLILLIGLLREALGTGMINMVNFDVNINLFNSEFGLTFLKDNSGGFILAGIIFGIISSINFKKEVLEHVS